jgi:hypothetical protein
MSLLSTGAMLLVLAAGGAPQAPRPIRFDGPLVFQQGVPRIEGCEKNVMLLWKRQGEAPPAYQHPIAGPQDMGEDRERVTLTLPGCTYDLVLKKKELRLEVKVDVGGKVSQREVDLREVFGEAVKEARFVTLEFAGITLSQGAPASP